MAGIRSESITNDKLLEKLQENNPNRNVTIIFRRSRVQPSEMQFKAVENILHRLGC